MLDYLITGGNGFVGRNLVNRLNNEDKFYKIVDLCICPEDRHNTVCIDASLHLPSVEAKSLVHLASETQVRESIEHPTRSIRRTIDSTLNGLELLRSRVFKSMVITTSANAKAAQSPYLASKSCCEDICKAYKMSYDLDIRILKLSSVYGPYSTHKNSVVAAFIKNCINRKPLTIFGNGDQVRDFVYVGDVIDAIVGDDEGFIASGETFSIKTLASLISDLSDLYLDYVPKIVYENAIAGEVVNALSTTDIKPKVMLEEGLRLTFEWFLENYNAKQVE